MIKRGHTIETFRAHRRRLKDQRLRQRNPPLKCRAARFVTGCTALPRNDDDCSSTDCPSAASASCYCNFSSYCPWTSSCRLVVFSFCATTDDDDGARQPQTDIMPGSRARNVGPYPTRVTVYAVFLRAFVDRRTRVVVVQLLLSLFVRPSVLYAWIPGKLLWRYSVLSQLLSLIQIHVYYVCVLIYLEFFFIIFIIIVISIIIKNEPRAHNDDDSRAVVARVLKIEILGWTAVASWLECAPNDFRARCFDCLPTPSPRPLYFIPRPTPGRLTDGIAAERELECMTLFFVFFFKFNFIYIYRFLWNIKE